MRIQRALRRAVLTSLFLFVAWLPPALAAPGLQTPVPLGAYMDGVFPDSTPGLSLNADWTTQNAFPNLNFVEPVRIVEHPTENKLFIVSKDGQVNLIDDTPSASQKTLFLDLRGQVKGPAVGEGGLAGLVLHPEFGVPGSPNRGYIYVWYRWGPSAGKQEAYERLSRFTVPDGAESVDPNSEFILIQQYDRSPNHIGGDMFFGSDGFLYLGVGDEGNCCDRTLTTQRVDLGLFSGILRIDVDQDPSRSHPIRRQPLNPDPPPSGWPDSYSQGYYIPSNNPFVDPSGANLEEFFAIGLRHPWTVSLDTGNGDIWAADVGELAREEVDLVFKGANHQWAYKEGSLSGKIAQPFPIIGTEAPPIWEYDRTVGRAIIGAGVYRGALYPELVGKYMVSDFVGGQLWTLDLPSGGGAPQVEQIAQLPGGFTSGINSYRLTTDGRILLAKTSGGLDPGGTVLELVRQGGNVTPQPPALLSQTGAFQNLATLDVNPGCIPYNLNVPFWSDAALKSRWMCIPNDSTHDSAGEQILFSENGEWEFPVGAVLIKHFELDLSEVSPGTTRRLETRFIVRAPDSYYGVTYQWRPDGSDADLLFESVEEDITIETATGSRVQTWHYPGRNECLRCHNTNAGGTLGPNTRQLNRSLLYPQTGITANQLETLNHLGIFSPAINVADIPTFLTATPTDDTGASLAARARSYLDSNCAYCHRPGGVRANFDARLTTPLADQNLVYGELNELFGIPGEAVIVPESLDQSVLYLRLNATSDQNGMPPLAKDRVDANGVAVVGDWINSLGGFNVGNSTQDAPFIDQHNPSLIINEADTWTNDDGQPVDLNVAEFNFYARNVGNPVTPLVVRVDSDNDFTVLAIGTTRTSSEYFTGSNTVPFSDAGGVTITVQPGETIATGFMDSFPDGSGWGFGTVIPAVSGSGQDEMWALLPSPLILASEGFVAGRDTAAVVEGESPLVTNAGKSLNQYTSLTRSYQFSIRFDYGFDSGGGGEPPPPTGDGFDVTLGNDAVSDGQRIDGWLSNLVINESDTYTNTSGALEQVSVDRFQFYARRAADPVTPFVVRVNGDNSFTVLAIGTTRTGYSVGANDVAFSTGGPVTLSLDPGDTLATGFLDAFADGSGGGSGSVIPWDAGGDELWYSGGSDGNDAGRVTVGQPPLPGSSLRTDLTRTYHYQMSLAINGGSSGGGGNQAPVAVAGGPYGGIEAVAIDFDGSGSYDDDTDPLSYSWDFGDGSTGTGVSPSHTYAAAGTYTVSLTVNDGSVDSAASTTDAVVSAAGGNQTPVAVVGGPYSGTEGVAIDFDGSGSFDNDTDPLSYSWDFGDGATGTGVSPSHTYAAAGTYTVSLTVNDGSVDSPVSTTDAVVSAAGGGTALTLGNDALSDGERLDGWLSNLVINETDTYSNSSGSAEQVNVEQFDFYARQVADPVTPFVVRVNADNDFTVLAIGTARTGYSAGANSFAFSTSGPVTVTLNPGETLATGFLDAFADGSGGGSGAVIPWDAGGDELWYTGGTGGADAGSVAIGGTPVSGSSTLTGLSRVYHYRIGMTVGSSGGGGNQAPVAVVGGPYGGTEGVAIDFDGSGSFDNDTDPLSYSWDFGDGATGTGVSPSHTYVAAGTYTVSLTVNDGTVDSAVSTTDAVVSAAGGNQTPVAVVGGPYSGTEGVAIDFDGSGSFDNDTDPLSYSWDFGDGATGTGVSPSHAYVAAGTYTVSLTVNDGTVDSPVSTTDAVVSAAGGGSPGFQQDAGTGMVVFEAEHADASIARSGYSWVADFTAGYSGDSGMITSPTTGSGLKSAGYSALSPELNYLVNFTRTGTHYVWVRGFGNAGNNNSVHVGLDGVEMASTTGLNFPPSSSWRWYGGVGVASFEVTSTGVHTVNAWMRETGFRMDKLVVTSDAGFTPTDTGPAESPYGSGGGGGNQAPVAVVGGPYSGTEGVAIDFDGSGSFDNDTDPLSYSWDFGDGATGTGVSPNHTYATVGTYTVSLTVNDGTVDSAVSSTDANVSAAGTNQTPVAVVGGPYSGTEGVGVTFDGSGSFDNDTDPLSYSWEFGDGATGTGVSPSHTYAAAGTYTVSLTVNDGTVDSAVSSTDADISAASGGGTALTLGNSATSDGSRRDGWSSNLVVNESDTYSNSSGSAEQVSVEQFDFYAWQVADPVTPFVARVNADNDFTVLAVGTTRTGYSVGANSYAFSSGGPVTVTLNPGETLVTGFLDAFADGSGGGSGSVIPWDAGGDELWYTGGTDGVASGSVTAGLPPLPGPSLLTGLTRTYHYSIGLTVDGGSSGGGNQAPVAVAGGPYSGTEGVAIDFDGSGSFDNDTDPLSYSWGFGDGATGTGVSPSHAYAAAGSYTVSLTVNDGSVDSAVSTTSAVVGTAGGSDSIANGSFEADALSGSRLVTGSLTGWGVTLGTVELLDSGVYPPPDGDQTLDLNGNEAGTIQQTLSGLTPNATYTLYLSYADQSVRGRTPELVTADILVNGVKVGDIRTTSDAPGFITCNGYEFISAPDGTAIVSIQSTVTGLHGAVVDAIYLQPGGLPQPPESSAVVNGGFETPISGDPHLCGDQLPGWRVTQENVDVVGSGVWPAFEGIRSLDLSGHGPGGIAQTVAGLTPGQTYTLSFAYARHIHWGSDPLTADVFVNGSLAAQLTATTSNEPPNWLTMSIPVVAPADGKITLEFRSTAEATGGGVVLDNVKLF